MDKSSRPLEMRKGSNPILIVLLWIKPQAINCLIIAEITSTLCILRHLKILKSYRKSLMQKGIPRSKMDNIHRYRYQKLCLMGLWIHLPKNHLFLQILKNRKISLLRLRPKTPLVARRWLKGCMSLGSLAVSTTKISMLTTT